jgi:hypothetical protein
MNRMLQRMAGNEGGIRDALTRYTTPPTGAYYVVPANEALRAFSTGEINSERSLERGHGAALLICAGPRDDERDGQRTRKPGHPAHTDPLATVQHPLTDIEVGRT